MFLSVRNIPAASPYTPLAVAKTSRVVNAENFMTNARFEIFFETEKLLGDETFFFTFRSSGDSHKYSSHILKQLDSLFGLLISFVNNKLNSNMCLNVCSFDVSLLNE